MLVVEIVSHLKAMKTFQGYSLLTPEKLEWKEAKPMRVPYADLLEHSGSENIGARLWKLPPKSANTWHKHVRAEEYYFVLEGTGRMRVGNETLTIPKHGGVLVGPDTMRQVFNDGDHEVLWLIVGAPDKEFESKEDFDLKLFWPEDPTQLPTELKGVAWPPLT